MITLQNIKDAYNLIHLELAQTQCLNSRSLSQHTGCNVFLKLENMQMTGSFKERGALNKILSLSQSEQQRGVITASAGNHAQGVAYHAHRLGGKATILMPEGTPINKINATRRYHANIILFGKTYDESYQQARDIQQEEGLNFIPAFDDTLVMAGQGTIGLEIIQEGLKPDAVICPIGGGGLMSGVATAIKETYPKCRMIGVQNQNAPSMKHSLEQGHIVASPSQPSLADGITVKNVGELTFPVIQKYVDEIHLVDEAEIAASILTFLEMEKILVEGAAAVTLAALNYRELNLAGKNVVLIISGGNIDINLLSKIIERGMVKDGRMVRLRIELQDTPGQLAFISDKIAQHKANVIEVYHNRSFLNTPMGKAYLDITLETRGMEHVHEIIADLKMADYSVTMV